MLHEITNTCNGISTRYQDELNKVGNTVETYNILIAALDEVATRMFPLLQQTARAEGYESKLYQIAQQKTLELISFYAIQLVRIDTNNNSIEVLKRLDSKCDDPLIKKKLNRYCDQLIARSNQIKEHFSLRGDEQPVKKRHLQLRYIALGVFVLLVIIAMNTEIQVRHEPLRANSQTVAVKELEKYSINPHVTESIDYYNITGMSETELWQQMKENGQPFNDNKRHAASVFYNVIWNVHTLMNEESCLINKVEVLLDVKYHMPHWSNQDSAPSNLRDWWARCYDVLLRHENGHRDLAEKAAREVQQKISEIPPHKTCKDLTETVNNTGNSVIDKYHQLQLDYDERTKLDLDQNAAGR
ncbi:MAG: hypothetical protein A2X79_08220 [Desulfuromonadaceae bacterium GWB2_53_15]|nr:MAG: hypothetical protein A2X79_08220 [Desulfuromonadaceae bacterium GWB2_53_15]